MTMACRQCGKSFTLDSEGRGVDQTPPVCLPFKPPTVASARVDPRPGKVNAVRLGLVLGGMLLYLLGGMALGFYCLMRNAQKPVAEVQVEKVSQLFRRTKLRTHSLPRPAPSAVDPALERRSMT